MKNAVINSTGSYLPERQLSNQELEASIDTTHEWIFTRTGIASRYIASDEETTSYMAGEAAKDALKKASISADEIDLIIVATCTPNQFFPGTACYVQHALGITKPIPAFDINAACSGFIYVTDIAHQYIRAGSARNVLVIGSETMSRTLNWKDRSTCVLFGDGAGAILFSASDENRGILASRLHSIYDTEHFLALSNNSWLDEASFVTMRGNEVFKLAVNLMGDIIEEVLELAQLQQNDINWLIPHQANIRIIQAIARKLKLPMSQVVVTIENHGNTSAASIPLALDSAINNNQIKRGDLLLLESFGAGMTWGANILRY